MRTDTATPYEERCHFWLCRILGHRAFKMGDRPGWYFRCLRTTKEI